jgi:glycosyltransferase involved in cell wall biosynthesis
VLEVRPQARFVMAGTGEMLGECIQYALEHGMANRVAFTGFVDSDDLADVYAHNGLYVLPSVSEPFGISVLEAMATGLPTLVSRTCGVGEALHHVLRSGYDDTNEMAEMIVALLDSSVLREELGRNGAHEAARFTWDSCATRTLAVYRQVAPNAPAIANLAARRKPSRTHVGPVLLPSLMVAAEVHAAEVTA